MKHHRPILGRSTLLATVATSIVAMTGSAAFAQCYDQVIPPIFPQTNAQCGLTLAVAGPWMIMGEPLHSTLSTSDGLINIYRRDNNVWTGVQVLYPPVARVSMNFGTVLDSDGSWLAVGDPGYAAGGFSSVGRVYVYRLIGSQWTLTNVFAPPAADTVSYSNFGLSVAVRSGRMAFGGYANGGSIVTYVNNNGTWQFEQRIPNPQPADNSFGSALSIDGDFMIAGSPFASTSVNRSGIAYIYRRSNGAWSLNSAIGGRRTYEAMGQNVCVRNGTFAASGPGQYRNVAKYFAANSYSADVDLQLPESVHGFTGGCVTVTDDGQTVLAGLNAAPRGNVGAWTRNGTNWNFAGYSGIHSGTIDGGIIANVAVDGNYIIAATAQDSVQNTLHSGKAVRTSFPSMGGGTTCEHPTEVGIGSFSGCTTDGQIDMAHVCAPSVGNAAWFRFTPPCPGTFTISTPGSAIDTVLAVYDTCPTADSTPIACNDDVSAGIYWSSLNLSTSQPVYIRVAGYSAGEGRYALSISRSGSLNDTCERAVVTEGGATPFCTDLATDDGLVDLACTGSGTMHNDIWFSFTPPCSGLYQFSSCDVAFDTVMAVYQGGCAGVANGPIACNDDNSSCGSHAIVETKLVEGTEYLVRLGAYYANTYGTGTLYIYGSTCPADFNADGGVDGGDIGAFFQDWESGSLSADVNCDGGVDGSDVNVFFAAWEAGGC
jgi:hypothetical protein